MHSNHNSSSVGPGAAVLLKNSPKRLLHSLIKFKHQPFSIFLREMLSSPRTIGAACPSSSRLARTMATQAAVNDNGLVLELGGGTGVVTKALLEQGIAQERLIIVERLPTLARHLMHRFPELRIIEGDAAHLQALLGEDFQRIRTIVSSLPLRSLPPAVVGAIGAQLKPLLQNGATLIQFTYDLRGHPPHHFSLTPGSPLQRLDSQIVWRNFPPARVDLFRHCQ